MPGNVILKHKKNICSGQERRRDNDGRKDNNKVETDV